jgi:hypothetical protein
MFTSDWLPPFGWPAVLLADAFASVSCFHAELMAADAAAGRPAG